MVSTATFGWEEWAAWLLRPHATQLFHTQRLPGIDERLAQEVLTHSIQTTAPERIVWVYIDNVCVSRSDQFYAQIWVLLEFEKERFLHLHQPDSLNIHTTGAKRMQRTN